ncbi:helix-turn-helix domain-containing protein [Corynebacterium hesseae]|uniref:Helix-turn-helix domain-containing protein n=1 Tax=Corynebacterium hesseae TaxID=2913502 RepID=A0ABU9UHZ6_9CORY
MTEIKQRVLAGESKAALAREFGVTRPTVYRALKNA